MKTVILKELKPYSISELLVSFSMDEDEISPILEKLSLKNIVKNLSNGKDSLSLEAIMEEEDVSTLINLEPMYTFNYVGIVSVKNICLVIYPKYFSSYKKDTNFKAFKQIISVIMKYQGKNLHQGFSEVIDTNNFNLIAVTLELLKEYNNHNLYRNEKKIIETNGAGEILWDKTINEKSVYIFDEKPYYLDLYTVNSINNEEDFFRRLHASIITEACELSKNMLDIIGVQGLHLSNETIRSYGSIDFLIQRINQEMSQQFITSQQRVLNLMKSYLNRNDYSTTSDCISFVGTTSFDRVWEDVCKTVMGDCLNLSLKEMGLTYSKSKGDSTLLSEIIPKPKWVYVEEDGIEYIHKSKKSLEPDIVIIDSKHKELSIYDPKYYNIKLDKNSVAKQPSVGDLNKQYMYELAYKKFAEENQLTIKENAFIMPSENVDENLGYAQMPIFSDYKVNLDLKDIKIILKSSSEMFSKYLRN